MTMADWPRFPLVSVRGAQPLRRPAPVDVERRPGEGPAAARLGRAEDEDAVGLRGPPGLVAPQLGHLANGCDVVERDPGELVALRLGSGDPGPLGQADPAADVPPAVGLDIADDEDHDRVVGEDRPQAGEDVAQEEQVRLAVVGIVEGRVDLPGIEAEEPRAQPVVVAVLDHPQIRRRGDDEAGAIGASQGAQRRAGTRRHVTGVAQQRDAPDRRRRLAEEAIELARQSVEHVALG